MQDLGRQTSHAALWNSQVVFVTSGIPVLNTIPRPAPGQDMLNSPISFCLSHYLYRSALINSLSINNAYLFVYFLHYPLFTYMFIKWHDCTHTPWYGKHARGFSTPHYGVRRPNTVDSATPRTYSTICISSESCLGSIVGFARLLCFGTLRSVISTKVAQG